jgi:hypothetical protein
MADIAHDASDPASPKPGDIALQQASRTPAAKRNANAMYETRPDLR